MTATLKVPVLKEHIERGTPQKCYECPLALAFRDIAPGVAHVKVAEDYIDYVVYEREGRQFRRKIPAAGMNFIRTFDYSTTGLTMPTEIELGPEEQAECTCGEGHWTMCKMHGDPDAGPVIEKIEDEEGDRE